MSIYLIVMAGGSGTRFWPKSTSQRPKQLLSFGSSPKTLIEATLDRFKGWVPEENQWVVTTQTLAKSIQEIVAPKVRVLAEPQGRNTAPCVFWAAQEIKKLDPNGVMIVVPSDHLIRNEGEFVRVLKAAVEIAQSQDKLVTLGVKPDRPETGYGYLQIAAEGSNQISNKVLRFVEKPNLENAERFVKSGDYLWNGGMFVWSVSSILKAFQAFMPEMETVWNQANGQVDRAYGNLTATSIDYGVMEKAKNVQTLVLDCGWDDLGSWISLENLAESLGIQQSAGAIRADRCVAIDSKNNIVDARAKLVALLGVEDLIVVETESTLLVAHKSKSQEIRRVVDEVKKNHSSFA